MFYAHIVLAKKGPLARIWLAAHWDKKLTKAHVFETDIEQSVEGILQPKVKLALRTSGHLLLGVVRIYSRKAKYLLADCNEAFVKIKMAFRPGIVDLPEEHREANVNAITLPVVFHDFDTALPELNDVDIEEQFSINQSRADEITMREEYGSLPMSIHDDGFGDMGFDGEDTDFMRGAVDTTIDESLMAQELEDRELTQMEPIPGTSRMLESLDHNIPDGFGDGFGQPAVGLFEGDLFPDDTPLPPPIMQQEDLKESDDDMDGGWDRDAPSPAPSSIDSIPPSVMPQTQVENPIPTEEPAYSGTEQPNVIAADITQEEILHPPDEVVDEQPAIVDEEESFALAPVDASALKGITKPKRKRKLIVDEVKNISGEEMKSQLANTSDIITTLDLAPPTKRLMYWKETGGVEKLFALPSRDIPVKSMFKIYQRHLQSRSAGIEDFSILGPADVLALEQYHTEQESPHGKRGRKRKLPIAPGELETSITEPSQIRDAAETAVTSESLDILQDISQQTLMQPPIQPDYSEIPTPQLSMDMDMNSMPMPVTPDDSIPEQVPSMTPIGLQHGGMTPAGLLHGGMTPVGLLHGGMTPAGLPHGGMTPAGLPHGGMTPAGLPHGGMTPAGLPHGGMTPSDLRHGAFTPVGLEHAGIEHLESIPHLPADQVSSILNGTAIDGFANMGYEEPAGNGLHRTGMSERVPTDWNEDYDFPPSVGAHQPGDEQMENETDEQFEERVLNKRAAQMFLAVRTRLHKKDSINLSEMTFKNNRKQAAQKFYSLLVLKKFQALDIKQEETYGDITVTKGVMFDNPKL